MQATTLDLTSIPDDVIVHEDQVHAVILKDGDTTVANFGEGRVFADDNGKPLLCVEYNGRERLDLEIVDYHATTLGGKKYLVTVYVSAKNI